MQSPVEKEKTNTVIRRRVNIPLVIVVAGFIAVGAGYARLMPAWQPSDEPFHFLYAEKILREGRLPTRDKNYQALHPPGYYALVAAAAAPVRGLDFERQLFYMRCLNVLLGALSLLLIYRTAREIGCGERESAAAAALGASIPMLTVSFASVTNDNLAIPLAWAAVWSFCRFANRRVGAGGVALAALLSGLAVGTKSNNMFLLPLFAAFYLAFMGKRTIKNILIDAIAFIVIFAPVGLWWHLHAYHLHGNLVFGNPVNEPSPFAFWLPANFIKWLRIFFGTFWMYVDFLRNRMPRRPEIGYYIYFLLATLIFLAGMTRALFGKSDPSAPDRKRLAWLFFFSFMLGVFEIWGYNRVSFVGTARYVFPALSGMLILWTWGLERLFGRHGTTAAFVFFASVQIINIVFLVWYIRIMPPLPFSITPAML